MSRGRARGGIALPAALAALAVSAALAGAIAELTRVEVVIARHRRVSAAALAAADTCLSRVLAGVPPDWSFAATLAGPDRVTGTADDGVVPAPAGCTSTAAAAPGAPGRLLLTVDVRAGDGHRALSAIAALGAVPGPPALLWLAALPGAGIAPGSVRVDGADAGDPTLPAVAGVAAPSTLDALDAWSATALRPTPATGLPHHASAPPFDDLVARVRAAGAAGSGLVAGLPAGPTVGFVAGDLSVPAALQGAGLLVVDGLLDVPGTLTFSGVIAARRLRVAGALAVDGAVWVGDPADPLRLDGTLTLRQRRAGVLAADGLLALPRFPLLVAIRDT